MFCRIGRGRKVGSDVGEFCELGSGISSEVRCSIHKGGQTGLDMGEEFQETHQAGP